MTDQGFLFPIDINKPTDFIFFDHDPWSFYHPWGNLIWSQMKGHGNKKDLDHGSGTTTKSILNKRTIRGCSIICGATNLASELKGHRNIDHGNGTTTENNLKKTICGCLIIGGAI